MHLRVFDFIQLVLSRGVLYIAIRDCDLMVDEVSKNTEPDSNCKEILSVCAGAIANAVEVFAVNNLVENARYQSRSSVSVSWNELGFAASIYLVNGLQQMDMEHVCRYLLLYRCGPI